MAFSPEYIRLVLNDNFEDAKALFLSPLLAIDYAHLVMLAETGIVSKADARAIRSALDRIDVAAVRTSAYDGTCEDLFFHVERLVAGACGDDVAGRLHTARSRNDIDMTMYRMRLREYLLDLSAATLALRRALIDLAAAHRDTVYPAHTHTQPAQPSTVAHYLLAAIEQLERDTARLASAYRSTNVNPLGACAITGTGFPIDRARTSELLGFDAPTGNTYGSIATVDYLIESTSAAATLVVGLGRVVQDLLLWCTAEVGYLRLDDSFVQVSSIMPQKRNPVALEHARALASKAFAELSAVPAAVHNTPFGDIVDTEDDLQPLVATAFRDATRAIALVAAAMTSVEFDVARMRDARGGGMGHHHRAGRHADARARRAVQSRARDRHEARSRRPGGVSDGACHAPRRRVTRRDRPRPPHGARRARARAQPGALHRSPKNLGRPRARRGRRSHCRLAAKAGGR